MLGKHQDGLENSTLGHNEICRDVQCKIEDTTTESKEVSIFVSGCNGHVSHEPYIDDNKGSVEGTVENNAMINTESSGNWCNFESSFLEESSSTSEWWEFFWS